MIQLDNITKIYDKTGQVALDNISLRVEKGEFVFIVGRSGAGKSTFIKLLLKEINPTEGKLLIDDEDITTLKKSKIPFLRRELGIVFQDFRLLDNRTVYENVAYAMQIVGEPEKKIKRRVPLALSMVGLKNRGDSYPQELSGGEQQRVAIARSIINGPKIMICDEPTGNLDPKTSLGIMKILNDINERGTTMVVATHDKAVVDRMQKRVITMDSGKIILDQQGGYHHEY
jgi:cell division transport system ATP-binding protein